MSSTDPTGASGGADEESSGAAEPSEESTETPSGGTESAGDATESAGAAPGPTGSTQGPADDTPEPSGASPEASSTGSGSAEEPGTEEPETDDADTTATPAAEGAVVPVTAATPTTPAALATTPNAAPPAKKRPRARRTRSVISWILIVLASLLIPISVMSAWAIRTVTNTDQYVATMAPLARNPVIVDHLATRATDALFSSHIVEKKLKDALPKKAAPILVPIRNEVKNYVYNLALKVFESPKFGQLWDALNRHTHEAIVAVLEGKHNELLSTIEKNGQIVLNVSPKLQDIINKANARGITIFNPVKTAIGKTDQGVSITIVSTQQVSKWSGAFNLLVKLGWWVPIIAILLGILSIVVAVRRRRALLRVAVGVALFTLLLLAALALGRNIFLQKVKEQAYHQDVAAAVWDTLLRNLKTDFRWMLLGSVLVALVAWVFGPARWAVAIRSGFARGGRWIAAAASGSSGSRRVGAWIQEHINALRILGIVVAAGFLLFGGNLTGWGLLVIVIVLAVYLALLQLIVLWARRVAGAPRAPVTPGVS
jgi:hypothetical protein